MIGDSAGPRRSRAQLNDARWALARRLELEALQRQLKVAIKRVREPASGATTLEAKKVFPEQLMRRILVDALETVGSWGGELTFVYLPGFGQLDRGQPQPHRAALLSLLSELKIELIDLDPVFREHPDPLRLFPFRHLGHYTGEGNDLVACEVLRNLGTRL